MRLLFRINTIIITQIAINVIYMSNCALLNDMFGTGRAVVPMHESVAFVLTKAN